MSTITYTPPTLAWSLSLSCGCTKMTFKETTCLSDDITCCDGYGVGENYNTNYPTRTSFTIIKPDGIILNDYDPSYLPDPNTDGGMEFDFTESDIAANRIFDEDLSVGSKFKDGVYTIKYYQYRGDTDLTTNTQKHLITCNLRACLKAAMKKAAGNCKCNVEKLMDRIQRVRMLLETAQYQFEDGDYNCAQDSIDRANKLCSNMCLNC